jgi:hypothetical protein
MADHMTKAALLDTIATSYASWQALVDRVPRERMTEPGVAGAWSLKDVIAHLTVYERWTADQMEANLRGEPRAPETTWGPPDGNTDDMDARNAAYYRHYRDTPLDAVLAAAQQHHQRLLAVVAGMSEADLNDPQKFPWTIGQPAWQAVAGNSYGHYDDHREGLRVWLEGQR